MGGQRIGFGVYAVLGCMSCSALLLTARARAQAGPPDSRALPPPPPPPPQASPAPTETVPPASRLPPAPPPAASAAAPSALPPAPPAPVPADSAVIAPRLPPDQPPIGVMSYPPPGRHPEPGLMPVYVHVSAGKRSFIVFGEAQRRIAECDEDCQFWAWPGTYRVRLAQTEHEPERSVRLRIRDSGNYLLQLGDSEARGAGLALGIVGSTIAAVGTIMWVAGTAFNECSYDTSTGSAGHCGTPSIVYYGLGTFVAGAGISAIGFVIFGNNGSGFHYLGEPRPLPMSARVGLVPLSRGGVGLGATLSF